jgi:hypothetical protein
MGKVGEFTAKTREEADRQLEETIARIAPEQVHSEGPEGPGRRLRHVEALLELKRLRKAADAFLSHTGHISSND